MTKFTVACLLPISILFKILEREFSNQSDNPSVIEFLMSLWTRMGNGNQVFGIHRKTTNGLEWLRLRFTGLATIID